MVKKNLHPELFHTKVFCDGKYILDIITIKPELHIEIWSGNHPFYLNSQKVLDIEKRIEKFNKKFNILNS
jgi:large subunit ribosomal protein L31